MTDSTLTKLRNRINSEIADRVQQLAFLDSLADKLADLQLDASFIGTSLDFDQLSHTNVIKVIKAFGGKWKKEPSSYHGGKVDYTQWVGDYEIRLWAGAPPPNCKVVEYDEVIPPQPERVVKRTKLVCTPVAGSVALLG